jgi:aconitate hydratase
MQNTLMVNTYINPINPINPIKQIAVGDQSFNAVNLQALCGDKLTRLPVVLRLLLENVARNMQGEERNSAIDALLSWVESGTSEAEIAFQPGRVLMHDTTSTPALVDLAAMRSTLAEAGIDPSSLNSSLPVDVSIDHSLAVEAFAKPDAPGINMSFEIRRNAERYTFLRWASKVLRGVRINPPGTGIMHTINLEQLATVVTIQERGGAKWLVPDMMIGTDSHTPMVNGIGVLGWGVGGLEAQTVMFGMPTMLRIPDVVGVRLTGALQPGVLATDLALTVTSRLRAIGVSGEFVEFFGPGVSSLRAGERCVIANMAPEYGATTGFFPVDQTTLDYLLQTGRKPDQVEMVRQFTQALGLWIDPKAEPTYTREIHIDMDTVGMHVAGPRRPQDLLNFGETASTLAALNFQPKVSNAALPRHPVALAAITSCTNTSDPGLLIAAALVARKARAFGLKVPAWVKSSLAPGSPAAASYLERAGLTADLAAVGFDIVGYGCTTCIGNSGPLPQAIQDALAQGAVHPVATVSGNRNFPGRIHPDLDLGFLMSPPLVIAFALAGDAERDFRVDPVQTTADGKPVFLKDLWPSRAEVDEALALSQSPADYRRAFDIATANPLWHALEAPDTELFPWRPDSTALRRPPFAALSEGSMLGKYTAYPLLVVGDDITTDHISPASAIPKDSLVADFLVERGDDRNDLNVFASRRGNWEVMVRAAFHSKTLKNLLAQGAKVAHTLHVPSGEILPLWEVAQRYRAAGDSVVLVAGERYGTGSSRDWAAKGQRLLGIRSVLANSFERIHRSNLIGMGVLPLRMPQGMTPFSLDLKPGDRLEVVALPDAITPRGPVAMQVLRVDGSVESFIAKAAVETQMEVELLRAGGVIPTILHKTIREQKAKTAAALGN